jgi:hypothetical protein
MVLPPKHSSMPSLPHNHYTTTTITIIVALAQFHLFLMVVSIPMMICFPMGCFHSIGYVRTISDGIKDHSVLTTTLWGAGMTWINATRYLGIVGGSHRYQSVAHVSIVVATYASFLTLRYDMFEIYHVLSAVIWIISSFIFHFSTTVQGVANRSSIASYVLGVGVFLATVFIAMFVAANFAEGPMSSSLHALSSITVIEVATVFSIILLDVLQSLHVLNECLSE